MNNSEALRDLLTKSSKPPTPTKTNDDVLQRSLRAIRTHLGMELAFISQFAGDQRELRYVDSDREFRGIAPGASAPLGQTYCKRMVDGAIPELCGDADVSTLPPDPVISPALAVGAYVSVPIRLRDGTVYGTLCSINSNADVSLNARDLNMMRAFADMAAEQIEAEVAESRHLAQLRARIQAVIDQDQLTIVYQPILDIMQNVVIGYESLSRFSAEPRRAPDLWFADAAAAGLGATLEMAAIHKALHIGLASRGDNYISVNASPANIETGEFARAVEAIPPERIVLEITEHAAIGDYSVVLSACRALRARGIRLAIDDAGSGYASFRHILSLEPDFIKLDMSLTRAIDGDSRRQALIAAFVAFASRTGSDLIAEGVETDAELDTLRNLGVCKAQGYLLGKPAPLPQISQS